MLPAGKPAQSCGCAAADIAGRSAHGPGHVAASGVAHDDVRKRTGGGRRDLFQDRRAQHLEPDEVEGLARHCVAGGLQDFDGVINGLVVALAARDARAVVRVGDFLQGGLMFADAFERHAFEQLLKRVVRACFAPCWTGCDGRRKQCGEQHESGGERRAACPRAHRGIPPLRPATLPGPTAGRDRQAHR